MHSLVCILGLNAFHTPLRQLWLICILQARGLLSAQALQQLQRGSEQQRHAAAVDPAKLPMEQQMPQILQLLSEKGVVSANASCYADVWEQGTADIVTWFVYVRRSASI